MKKTSLKGCVYDLSVDYDAIEVIRHSQTLDGKEWNCIIISMKIF